MEKGWECGICFCGGWFVDLPWGCQCWGCRFASKSGGLGCQLFTVNSSTWVLRNQPLGYRMLQATFENQWKVGLEWVGHGWTLLRKVLLRLEPFAAGSRQDAWPFQEDMRFTSHPQDWSHPSGYQGSSRRCGKMIMIISSNSHPPTGRLFNPWTSVVGGFNMFDPHLGRVYHSTCPK